MAAKGANNGALATRVLIMELHLRATLPDAYHEITSTYQAFLKR